MKTIIAGSRGIEDAYVHILKAIHNSKIGSLITEVVCGCAEGVDIAGFEYARDANLPVIFYPAWTFQLEWALRVRDLAEKVMPIPANTKTAGHVRNVMMAKHADVLLAIWNRKSLGTRSMIEKAEKAKLKVFIHTVK